MCKWKVENFVQNCSVRVLNHSLVESLQHFVAVPAHDLYVSSIHTVRRKFSLICINKTCVLVGLYVHDELIFMFLKVVAYKSCEF